MQASRIQDNIEALPEKLQSLTQKSEWNAAQPISRLPPEVLVRIFNLTRADCYWSWDWLILTTICRQWRIEALSCPSLWADITDFRSISKTKTFLERSKSACIKVSLSMTDSVEFISSFLEILHPHMKRVQSLSFTEERRLVGWHKIQRLFRNLGPYSRMKYLRLSLKSLPSLCFDEDIVSSLNFRLHELILEGISLPWNHQILQGLCHLRLTNISDHLPTLSEILDILESCPSLHSLHLCNAGPRSTLNASLRLIQLNKLENMEISGIDFSICTELLDSIIIPPEAECSIICSDYPFSDPRPLFPEFLARRNQWEQLVLSFTDDYVNLLYCQSRYRLSQTNILLEWERSPDLGRRIMGIFSSFPIIAKQSCCYEKVSVFFSSKIHLQEYALKKDIWLCLLDSLPMLKSLKVGFSKSYPETITEIISALMELVNVDVPYSFRCTELEEIRIEHATFSSSKERKSFENFMEHLKDRSDHGKCLKKLELLGCFGISKRETDDIQRRNIVDEVTVSFESYDDSELEDDSD